MALEANPVTVPDRDGRPLEALLRRSRLGPRATHGTLTLGFQVDETFVVRGTWVTLELPWRDNRIRVSCIPAGTYTLRPHTSGAVNQWNDGHCLAVEGCEPERTLIRVHSANEADDLLGCIAVGVRRVGDCIELSRQANLELLELVGDETVELTIMDPD